MSASRSVPTAPNERTCAPSLARLTAVPAAVPAAVARISVSLALPWPDGIVSTGRPSTSRICTPTWRHAARSLLSPLAVAPPLSLGRDLVKLGR